MTQAAFKNQPPNNGELALSALGTILLVDDDRTLRLMLSAQLEQLGYEVLEAANGAEAFVFLENTSNKIDMILLDREMPVMDGMQFIKELKKNDTAYRHIPVIMITGYGSPEEINQGIASGVFYYLVKPISPMVLGSVVSSAHREARLLKKQDEITMKNDTCFSKMTEGYFTISTLSEAEHLSRMLARCYEDPERVISGISALIVNAIEHGNLGIGFETKSRLLNDGNWEEEVLRRQELPENRDKKVHITYQRTAEFNRLVIRDEGSGFDWKKFQNLDSKKMTSINGRGIIQAQHQSFDKVQYNPEGNQVTATNYHLKYGISNA